MSDTSGFSGPNSLERGMSAEEVNRRLDDEVSEGLEAELPLTGDSLDRYIEQFDSFDPAEVKAFIAAPLSEAVSGYVGRPVTGQVYAAFQNEDFQKVEVALGTGIKGITSYEVTDGEPVEFTRYDGTRVVQEPEVEGVDTRILYENPFTYHAWESEENRNHFIVAPSSSNEAYLEDLNDIL